MNPEPRERDWFLVSVLFVLVAILFGAVLFAVTTA